MGYATVRPDELETHQGLAALRRRLGIEAFGLNAWRAAEAGGTIIGEHDEEQNGHQELYVVLNGHATFTIDGEDVDAPAGTVVALGDTSTKRKAVATQPGTTILAIGAPAGERYEPLAMEWNLEAMALFGTGDYEGAKALLLKGLEQKEDAYGMLYNLACAESRLGNLDAAYDCLARTLAGSPQFAVYAESDDDLAALRDDPRFRDLLGSAVAGEA